MSRPSYRGLVLLSSASLGLLAASIVMHAIGCANSSTTSGEDVHNLPGACQSDGDGDKCRDTTAPNSECRASDNKFPFKPDGSTCDLSGPESKDGICKDHICILACSVPPSTCKCTSAAGMITGCPASTICEKWTCLYETCNSVLLDGPVDGGDTGNCGRLVCKSGKLSTEPASPGATCKYEGGSGYCDDSGNCAPCVPGTTKGCGTAGDVCYRRDAGTLACTQCTNDQQDPDETDKNCGGVCAKYNAGATPKCDNGKKCVADTDCANGPCVDGFCCESVCNVPCFACANPGLEGLCRDVPTGTMDPICGTGTGFVCVAGTMGNCFGRAGAECTQNAQCMSNVCTTGKCAKGLAGTPCADDTDCGMTTGTPPTQLTCQGNHTCG